MDSKTLKTFILIILVAGICIGGFFLLFEKAEKDVYTPGSREARQNPFLAAQRYLNKIGISAGSSNRRDFLTSLPPVGDMIFLIKSGISLPEKRENSLVRWVENGGGLVIKHDFLFDSSQDQKANPLLEKFGITLKSPDETEDKPEDAIEKTEQTDEKESTTVDEKSKKGADDEDCVCESSYKETVDDVFRGETMDIEFLKASTLEPAGPQTIKLFFLGEYGPHMIRKTVGTGEVIVLSDDLFLRNKRIGENDHAYFLQTLCRDRNHVWFMYNSIMPSFISLVAEKMPWVIASLILLVIFSFFRLTLQIGPVYKLNDTSNRNIIEHLLSAGHFVRKQRQNKQIQQSRDALEKKIRTRYLQYTKKSRNEQIALIANWAEMTEADVYQALEQPVKTTHEYIKTTRLIKNIEDEIVANYKQTER